ncbi:MAG: P-II family nitrogen regulator [Prochlorothrix sp.]|nr:P-II family nitrogen regulator [Prochlorothrix sp.]
MNKITAVIRLAKLQAVQTALINCGAVGMTATEVQGYGRQRGHTVSYRGAKQSVEFHRKLRLEVVVSAEQTQETMAAIVAASQTGEIGDGKIFVSPVEQTIRIRTQEQDEDAL